MKQDKLTKEQREILHLITKEFLTPREVAQRRQTSTQAVYKSLKRLRKKGLISTRLLEGLHKGGVAKKENVKNALNLHNIRYRIKLLWKSDKYERRLIESNKLSIDNNTVTLYKEVIIVESNKIFIEDTSDECMREANNYFTRFFHRLEGELGVLIIKDRYRNIKVTGGHIEHMNNPLAKNVLERGDKLNCETKEGKIWLTMDRSLKVDSIETTEPQSHYTDMSMVIEPFFNDLRDNYAEMGDNIPKLSEIMQLLKLTSEMQREQAAGILTLIKILTPQTEPLTEPDGGLGEPAHYIG